MGGYVYSFPAVKNTSHLSNEEALAKLKEAGQLFSEQQKAIINTQGAMNVVSCAGSGKTHTLVNLVIKRILTGEIEDPSKVLLTTFSKAGAGNMQARLNALYSDVGLQGRCPVEVRTMHSIYLKFLRLLWQDNLPKVISEGERNMYVRRAAKGWKGGLTDDEVKDLSSLLSYQVNNLASLESIYSSYIFTLDMTLDQFKEIHENFYQLKRQEGVMDFDDMQYNTYHILYQDPNKDTWVQYIRNFVDIYVDEFQDTSKMQYAILQKMIVDKNKCLFIGDDDQCIYEWRGSDPNIMLNIFRMFPDIKKLNLDTNYRCHSTILEFARTGVEHISVREQKSMVSSESGGSVEFVYGNSKNINDYVEKTVTKIKELMSLGTSLSDIAVLSRQNATSSLVYAELVSNKIWVSADAGVKISNQPFFKDVVRLVKLCENGNRLEITSMLWKMIHYFSKRASDLIADLMKSTGCTLEMAIECLLYYGNVEGHYKSPVQLNARQTSRVRGILSSLSRAALADLAKFQSYLKSPNNEEALQGFLKMYYFNCEEMTKGNNAKRMLLSMYTYFSNKLTEVGFDKFCEFVEMLQVYESIDPTAFDGSISMKTMHGAKGLEWKYVFLFAYDNYTFPDAGYIAKQVEQEDLPRYLDGERRLAYVSSTRAVEKLYVVTDVANVSYLCLEQLGLSNRALIGAGVMTNDAKGIQSYLGWVAENEYRNPRNVWLDETKVNYVPQTHLCEPKKAQEETTG